MADWRKTKCCGTCSLYNLDALKDKAGRIRGHNAAAQCAWESKEVYPASINWRGPIRPKPSFMSINDGAECECHIPREAM